MMVPKLSHVTNLEPHGHMCRVVNCFLKRSKKRLLFVSFLFFFLKKDYFLFKKQPFFKDDLFKKKINLNPPPPARLEIIYNVVVDLSATSAIFSDLKSQFGTVIKQVVPN